MTNSPRLKKCPLCNGPAHMAEVTVTRTGKTYYAAVCNRDACRLSEPPGVRLCFADEDDAIGAWNGGRR